MVEKSLSSIDIAIAVEELKEKVTESRVNKIYQYDKNIIVLKLHKKDNPQIRLVLESGKRIHLTSYVIIPPKVPPGFCMALRKYLNGAWLDNIEQYEFERIVILSLRKKSGSWKLILELFGEGNIILTDENNKILQAIIFKKMRDRNIIRNELYKFPPSFSRNPFKIQEEELKAELNSFGNIEVVRAIARLLGLGGIYSEEILSQAEVEKNDQLKNLNNQDFTAIFNSLQKILSKIRKLKITPKLILDENEKMIDVIPLDLKRYEKFKKKSIKTFNEALDKFYLRDIAQKQISSSGKSIKINRKLDEIKRIIDKQKKVIEKQKNNVIKNKLFGDTIYSHYSELQLLLNIFSIKNRVGKTWAVLFKEVMAEKKQKKIPATYIESFDSKKLLANLNLNGIQFSLDLKRTLHENAGKYYDLSKKAKQKSEGAKFALNDSLKKLEKMKKSLKQTTDQEKEKPNQVLLVLEKNKIKSKKWYEKFRWFKTSEGFLVVAGKDAVSNEVLIKKYTDPTDPVFHADLTGAPFVVIKATELFPGKQSLNEASEFAASLSRGWREGAGTVDVYCVKPSQLSKSGTSGEFVPRGGFVVFGKRNWFRNVPLKLAIGVIKKDKTWLFTGGPISSVKAYTNNFVILIPGNLQGKELLKAILRSLALKMPKELRETISKTSIEEIREFVPYTKGRIINSQI